MANHEELGGSEDFTPYLVRDTVPSCDKVHHALRSIHSQPNHLKHWGNLFTYEKPDSQEIQINGKTGKKGRIYTGR